MLFSGKTTCPANAPKVVCSENQNKHVLNNPALLSIYKYKVDGDILTHGDGKKCDYIVEVETQNKPTAYVIELKGSDLEEAIRQIETTINRFTLARTHRILPRIIIHKARTHQVQGSAYRNLRRKYPQTVLKEKLYEETVS